MDDDTLYEDAPESSRGGSSRRGRGSRGGRGGRGRGTSTGTQFKGGRTTDAAALLQAMENPQTSRKRSRKDQEDDGGEDDDEDGGQPAKKVREGDESDEEDPDAGLTAKEKKEKAAEKKKQQKLAKKALEKDKDPVSLDIRMSDAARILWGCADDELKAPWTAKTKDNLMFGLRYAKEERGLVLWEKQLLIDNAIIEIMKSERQLVLELIGDYPAEILKLKSDQIRLKILEQECRKLELELRLREGLREGLREAGQAGNVGGEKQAGNVGRESDDREKDDGESDDGENDEPVE